MNEYMNVPLANDLVDSFFGYLIVSFLNYVIAPI